LLQHPGHVVRLDGHDHDIGVGDGPRRARSHVDTVEGALQRAAAVGVDLGDDDRVALPAGVEEPPDEGLAHPAASEEREASHDREATDRERPNRCALPAWECRYTMQAAGRARARGTIGLASHFPERDSPSCTSGPAPAVRAAGPRPPIDAGQHRPRSDTPAGFV
jgi:hypothetical protein